MTEITCARDMNVDGFIECHNDKPDYLKVHVQMTIRDGIVNCALRAKHNHKSSVIPFHKQSENILFRLKKHIDAKGWLIS